MKRGVLILDDFGGATPTLADVLSSNGYVVHVVTSDRRARVFVGKAVYIHVLPSIVEGGGGDVEAYTILSVGDAVKDIDFDSIEVALLLSPNEELNLIMGRLAREKGVPIVIAVFRDPSRAREARDAGIEALDISHYIVSRVQRILSLKFSKLTPISGNIYMLEMLVTGDSRILGMKVEDVERSFSVDVALVREGRLIRQQDSIIQAGDYLIAVGLIDSLRELQSLA